MTTIRRIVWKVAPRQIERFGIERGTGLPFKTALFTLPASGRGKFGQPCAGGKAETIVTVLCFQHFEHRLRTIMTVAAHEDLDLRPVLAAS